MSDDNLANLAHAPVTIQEEVPGTNIRVFVAGDRVLACEVYSAAIDFRDDEDPRDHSAHLAGKGGGMVPAGGAGLELLWTGIDLRLTPERRYLFLEANPSPMFLGFESRSGLPLSDSLAALLLEGETGR